MIKLVREETPELLAAPARHQWPVRITATYTADDGAAPVFVMKTAADAEFGDGDFFSVATVRQLDDLPVDSPGPDDAWYLASVVTVTARSEEAAGEFHAKTALAVQKLVNSLAAVETLSVEAETVIVPADAV